MKKVIQSAQDKGYTPILCHIAKFGGSATLPHTITDEAGQLCELTLIQKWLREEHKIHIALNMDIDGKFSFNTEGLSWYDSTFKGQYSYEEALLNGISEALKLISKPILIDQNL